jgi:4-hydroxy-3-polyprenylbenzoate decarboxylase
MPGVIAISGPAFTNYQNAHSEIDKLTRGIIEAALSQSKGLEQLNSIPFIVLCDDAGFTAATLRNYLWVTYTRCNPSHDIYGVNAFTENKHWGCRGPLIIDARIKPHHAPPVATDPTVEKNIDRFFAKGGSLANIKV